MKRIARVASIRRSPRLPATGRLLVMLATLFAVAASIIPVSRAQTASPAVSVEAILDPRRITAGGQATFSIEITGGQAEGGPPQIQAPGLLIVLRGQQNMPGRIVNGVTAQRFNYIYSVSASSPGRFTIPSVLVTVGGSSFHTGPQELVVQAPSEQTSDLSANAKSSCFVDLELPKRDLYVREVIPLKLTLYVIGRNTISGVGHPEMERENLVMKRFPTSPRPGVVELDGRLYSTLTLETSLFAIDEGKITVGPCSLAAMFYETQGNNPQAPSIFRRAVRKTLLSNAIELNVKALPEKGQPRDFTGAIGSFALAQKVSPTRLNTGDPISVDIEISGIGNFDSLEAPAMEDSEGWQLYPPREFAQNLSDGVVTGKITYSQVIIPLREHREVPPFRFSYFDPEEERYISVESDPVPIEVTLDTAAAAAALSSTMETPGVLAAGRSPAQRPVEQLEDILTIRSETPAFRAIATPLLRSPVFWAAQSFPALAFLGLLGTGLHRRWKQWDATREKKAPARTCREIIAEMKSGNLSRKDFYRDTLACIDTARGARPPAGNDTETTPSEMKPPELTSELAQLEAAALGVIYGDRDAETSPGISRDEANAVLATLRRLDTHGAA